MVWILIIFLSFYIIFLGFAIRFISEESAELANNDPFKLFTYFLITFLIFVIFAFGYFIFLLIRM